MESAYIIEIEIPPAWWWEQAAAARLEARRLCPVDIDGVAIALKRLRLWRPGRIGQFEATYTRIQQQAPYSAVRARPFFVISGVDRLWVLGALVVVAGASVLAPLARPAPPPAIPTPAASPTNAPQSFEPAEIVVRDLSTILAAVGAGRIQRLTWKNEDIVVAGNSLDLANARAKLSDISPTRELIYRDQANED